MALLFMDGFDAADIVQKWSTINGSWFTDGATRFSSGISSRIGSPNGVTKFILAANQLYVGVAIKPGAADASTGIIRRLGHAHLDSTGKIKMPTAQ
jgi:hypothetical protein